MVDIERYHMNLDEVEIQRSRLTSRSRGIKRIPAHRNQEGKSRASLMYRDCSQRILSSKCFDSACVMALCWISVSDHVQMPRRVAQ
jgi:hypothetical protein